MASLSGQHAPQIAAACQANLGELTEALGRAWDRPCALSLGEAAPWNPAELAAAGAGPGLLVLLKVGPQGAALQVPAAGGLLPEWYAAPDPTGTSKLATLAQELGLLVLPDELPADETLVEAVPALAEALARGEPATDAMMLPWRLTSGETSAPAWLIWPLAQPAAVFAAQAASQPDPAPQASAAPASAPVAAAPPPTPASTRATPSTHQAGADWEHLPPYARSLLRIRVPVAVRLAGTKLRAKRVAELVPGTIIQFDKSCEEMLGLYVGHQEVAEGEAVKVGDKFGLRLTSMVLPEERFRPVRPARN